MSAAVICPALLASLAEAHSPGLDASVGGDDGGCQADQFSVWVGAILGSLTVGLVGVLPLLLLPTGAGTDGVEAFGSSRALRVMLGCAAGGLLGNALLHLLPEAYSLVGKMAQRNDKLTFFGVISVDMQSHHGFNGDMYIGLWVLIGIMTFIVLEKLVAAFDDDEDDAGSKASGSPPGTPEVPTASEPKGGPSTPVRRSSRLAAKSPKPGEGGRASVGQPAADNKGDEVTPERRISKRMSTNAAATAKVDPAGYLNCLVNTMDNFTHGLAVAGSFCVSTRVGVFTTIAIVIHEVPHELGDFAILIRSGFSKWQAINAQIMTSAGGLMGAIFGLLWAGHDRASVWILPFTAGGFIYIALVSLISDLLKEDASGLPWWRDVLHVAAGAGLVGYTATLGAAH